MPAWDDTTAEGDIAPTLAGDHGDDDGQLIGELIAENPNLDPPFGLFVNGDAVVPSYADTPPATTFTIGRRYALTAGGQIVQALPADPNRISLSIHIDTAGVGSDVVQFSSEYDLAGDEWSSFPITTTQPIDNLQHTGPVYLYAPDAAATVMILAITK